MTQYLGHNVTGVEWEGPHALRVDFESPHATQYHQLYAGRTLIGVAAPGATVVRGQMTYETTSAPLTVLAVDPGEQSTDHGSKLPERPWNRFQLSWSAASYPADSERFEVYGAAEPATAPDAADRLGSVPFTGDGAYTFDAPGVPLGGSNEWRYGVTPYDDTKGDDPLSEGNAGTEAVISVQAHCVPRDVGYDSDGKRFTVTETGGTATVTFTYPT
jgi:hypothetical protein